MASSTTDPLSTSSLTTSEASSSATSSRESGSGRSLFGELDGLMTDPSGAEAVPAAPFSAAGKRAGFADPRHLWPSWFRLIRECRPDVLFGEQSDEADAWIDLVSADLENDGYAIGTPDLPAAGFGGAHERQRFCWVADAHHAEWWSERAPWHDGDWPKAGRHQSNRHAGYGGADGWLGDANHESWLEGCPEPSGRHYRSDAQLRTGPSGTGLSCGLGDPHKAGLSDTELGIIRRSGWGPEGRGSQQPGDPSGAGVDWLFCRDSKWRPVESGTCPLVDAAPARMGRLRGYGDALDAETVTQFVAAYMEVAP